MAFFKSFKIHVEKATDVSFMGLHIDHGGEFISREFDNFCDGDWIKGQLTTAYQQNGVVEWKNHTFMNLGKCYLKRMCPNFLA